MFNKQYSFEPNLVILAGKIDLNASAAVLSTTDVQNAASVTKTGTGEYTITLNDSYTKKLSIQATVESDTDADLVAQIDSSDIQGNSAAKTIVIKTMAAAVPTDASAAATIYITILASL